MVKKTLIDLVRLIPPEVVICKTEAGLWKVYKASEPVGGVMAEHPDFGSALEEFLIKTGVEQ